MTNVPPVDFGSSFEPPYPAAPSLGALRPAQPPAPQRGSADERDPDGLIAALRAELLAHHRLALLGNISAMFAHEINNLLTPVLAYSQEALRDADAAFMRKALERAARQTERVVTIGRKFLELAHGAQPNIAPRPLQQIVDDTVLTLGRPFEKDRLTLDISVAPGLMVQADPILLEQLLLNLLLYVRDACGGVLGRVDLRAFAAGSDPVIEIAATCPRLAGAAQHGTLAAFFAADPRQALDDWQPLGMGLSICRLIARLHGTMIEASQPAPAQLTFRIRWAGGGGSR